VQARKCAVRRARDDAAHLTQAYDVTARREIVLPEVDRGLWTAVSKAG